LPPVSKSNEVSKSNAEQYRNTIRREAVSQKKLNQWYATAICGNDITSSCLYVSALALLFAGPLGPLTLLGVAGVLWLFRGIYSEVVGALPLNGGAYNALLNTTSKKIASLAACLTILSYLATAVISSSEAVHYAIGVALNFGAPDSLRILMLPITCLHLSIFAYFTIRGIGESAKVALSIFMVHISALTVLVLFCCAYVLTNGLGVLAANWQTPPPHPTNHPLFLGFCVAMLGISGFESSANFVEEQEEGVFPKTLRNMWWAVSIFNPLVCLLALAVIPLGHVDAHKEAFLAYVAQVAGGATLGSALSALIAVDAALVLSGAVLTSFVGVTGLIHRMTLDRCLPQFLLKRNRFGTFHRVVLVFLVLACVLLYSAGGVHGLAGVYTISFLSVMFLFCVGNGMLKVYRDRLPRDVRVSWLTIVCGGTAVACGLLGNISLDPAHFQIFLIYFVPTFLLVFSMLARTSLLKIAIYIVRSAAGNMMFISRYITDQLELKLEEINSQPMVFFTRGDNIANLNQAMLYVRENEHTNRIKIVTVVKSEEEVPPGLAADLKFLDQAYPEIDIEFVVVKGEFTPALLNKLSGEWHIPLNFMFIGSPGDRFPHQLSAFGGVRLII
jgi:amino acid transporter